MARLVTEADRCAQRARDLQREQARWRQQVERDWKRWCDGLVACATTARDFGAQLVIAAELELAATGDSYPSSSGGVGDGARASSISDPTGNRVAGQLSHPMVQDADAMRGRLGAALEELREAHRIIVDGVRRLRPPLPPSRAEAPECINCSRFEIYTPAARAGRCEECAAYRDAHGRDAGEKAIRSRLSNSTPRQVARRGAAIPAESMDWISSKVGLQ